MATEIKEAGSNKTTTRWMELKRLAAVVIEYVTSVNENGLDLYFLNRGVYPGVKVSEKLDLPRSSVSFVVCSIRA